jgi:hypothetical protein
VVEESLAARAGFRSYPSPPALLLKLVGLATSSWLLILVVALTFIVTPLAIGRTVFAIMHVDTEFHHDPICFAVGGMVLYALLLAAGLIDAEGIQWRRERGGGVHIAPVELQQQPQRRGAAGAAAASSGVVERSRGGRRSRAPPSVTFGLKLFNSFAMWAIATPLSLGVLYEVSAVYSAEDWATKGVSGVNLFKVRRLGGRAKRAQKEVR